MTWWFECQSCDYRTLHVDEALSHAKANKTRWTNRWYAHLMKIVNIDDSETGETYDVEQGGNSKVRIITYGETGA